MYEMKQPVWILSRTTDRWYNGKYEISNELLYTYPWYVLKPLVERKLKGAKLPCERLFFDPPRPTLPEWQPLSPEEIIRILG